MIFKKNNNANNFINSTIYYCNINPIILHNCGSGENAIANYCAQICRHKMFLQNALECDSVLI